MFKKLHHKLYNMKNYKSKLFVFLLLVSTLTRITAQEVVTTLGGNAIGSSGSVSYSVGQLFFNNLSSSTGTVSQGVQQPYEISTLGLENNNNDNISQVIVIYPNPTTDFLILQFGNVINALSYQIFDITGKLLKNEIVFDKENKIDMSSFIKATYFLKVLKYNQEVKVFKIIKN